MEDLVKNLESWIDEAIDHPEDRDGICKDLVDYVREKLEERYDLGYLRGARDAQRVRRTNAG